MTDSPYPTDDVAGSYGGPEITNRQIVRNQRTGDLEIIETDESGEEISRTKYDHPADAPPLS